MFWYLQNGMRRTYTITCASQPHNIAAVEDFYWQWWPNKLCSGQLFNRASEVWSFYDLVVLRQRNVVLVDVDDQRRDRTVAPRVARGSNLNEVQQRDSTLTWHGRDPCCFGKAEWSPKPRTTRFLGHWNNYHVEVSKSPSYWVGRRIFLDLDAFDRVSPSQNCENGMLLVSFPVQKLAG